MRKLLYYLSNILLGVYLIAYIPLLNYFLDAQWKEGYSFPALVNSKLNQISLIVLIIVIICKIIFNSKILYGIQKKDKIISIILLVIEIAILWFLGVYWQFA